MARRRPVRQHTPNQLPVWVLEQRELWVDARGFEHRIHEMDDDYVRNVRNFVRGRVHSYVFRYADWRGGMDELLDNSDLARAWLEERPLLRVLNARVARAEAKRARVRDHLLVIPNEQPASLSDSLHRRRSPVSLG